MSIAVAIRRGVDVIRRHPSVWRELPEAVARRPVRRDDFSLVVGVHYGGVTVGAGPRVEDVRGDHHHAGSGTAGGTGATAPAGAATLVFGDQQEDDHHRDSADDPALPCRRHLITSRPSRL